MKNIEKKEKKGYNKKKKFSFGEPCPPIPSLFFENKQNKKQKKEKK